MERDKIRITREEIDAEQAEWEARQEQEACIVGAQITEQGRVEFTMNMDMSNFANVVGPSNYYRYLGSIGAAEIIEPPKTVRSFARNIRRGGLVRLGSIKEILGARDAQPVLSALDDDDKRHRSALRRSGKVGLGR